MRTSTTAETEPHAEGNRRWAVILGASSGFGGATAVALARARHDIVGVHLDRASTLPAAEQVVADVEAAGRETLFFNVDASDGRRRHDIIEAIAERFADGEGSSTVSVLLHSLAFGSLRPFIATDGEKPLTSTQMDMTLNVMAHSLVYWTQELFEAGMLRSGAKVLSMTSAGSLRVWRQYGAVSAAKAALEAHTRQLAYELAPHGVSVNAVRAGVTDTPALRRIPESDAMIRSVLERSPTGRLTTVDDVAAFIAQFVCADNPWVTGNVLNVDGGELNWG